MTNPILAAYQRGIEGSDERFDNALSEMKKDFPETVEAIKSLARKHIHSFAISLIEAQREAIQPVIVEADSKLSLLRHRGNIKWGSLGMCEAYDVDATIGKLRALTPLTEALEQLKKV